MSRTSKIYVLALIGEDDQSFELNSGHARVYLTGEEALSELSDLKDMVIDHYEQEEHRRISPGQCMAVYELSVASVKRIAE